MGKKKVIRDYTQKEKLEKLVVIRKKLRDFGLGVYERQCAELGKIMNDYIKNDRFGLASGIATSSKSNAYKIFNNITNVIWI